MLCYARIRSIIRSTSLKCILIEFSKQNLSFIHISISGIYVKTYKDFLYSKTSIKC